MSAKLTAKLGLADGLSANILFDRLTELSAYDEIIRKFSGGVGTKRNPIIINSQDELGLLKLFCNKNIKLNFKLGSDIVLTGVWEPIKFDVKNKRITLYNTMSDDFYSNLDGNGHTISGLTLDSSVDYSLGLFHCLYGSVKDLRIEAQVTDCSSCGHAGAIAGKLSKGSIENCIASLTMMGDCTLNLTIGGIVGELTDGGRITNCYSKLNTNVDIIGKYQTDIKNSTSSETSVNAVAVSTNPTGSNATDSTVSTVSTDSTISSGFFTIHSDWRRAHIGGVAGKVSGKSAISSCVTEVTITGGSDYDFEILAGGIAGYLENSECNDCFSEGNIKLVINTTNKDYCNSVAGGLIGAINKSTVSSCKSYVDIVVKGGYHSCAGGLIGQVVGSSKGIRSSIQNSYATGKVQASGAGFQNNAGGLTCQVTYSDINECWAAGDVTVGDGANAINVAGGLCSGVYVDADVKNCYASGNLTENVSCSLQMIGSLTGRLEGQITNCYAVGKATINDMTINSYPYNTLVGSRRGKGGKITQCADYSDNIWFFINEPHNRPYKITDTSVEQAGQESTYTSKGWDFESIWAMPLDTPSLPILQGTDTETQVVYLHLIMLK